MDIDKDLERGDQPKHSYTLARRTSNHTSQNLPKSMPAQR